MTTLLQITPKPKTLRQLFAEKERWTQGQTFRDENGTGLAFIKDGAVSCCLHGAIEYVYGIGVEYRRVQNKIQTACDYDIIKFNDAPERTIEDIRAVVEKAGV